MEIMMETYGNTTCFQNACCKSSGIWDWVRFQIEPTPMICSWERLRPFLPNTAGGRASWCSQRRLESTPVRSLQRWSGAGGECSKPHLAIYGCLFLGDLWKWDRIPFPNCSVFMYFLSIWWGMRMTVPSSSWSPLECMRPGRRWIEAVL